MHAVSVFAEPLSHCSLPSIRPLPQPVQSAGQFEKFSPLLHVASPQYGPTTVWTTQPVVQVEHVFVSEQGGQVTKREYWGLRNLSYRIKKNRKGHYMLFNLDAPPAAVNELERNMRINEDVIRYLTVRVETLEEGPSVVMQSRNRGEERERGRRG